MGVAVVRETDVGPLPADWRVVTIGSLAPFVTSGSRGWAAYYADYGDPFIRITNLKRSSITLDLEDLRYVRLPKAAREGTRTELRERDVLISITADIGIAACVSASDPQPAYINQHIALVRFDDAMADGRFVAHYLASGPSQRVFRSMTDTGAKAGMNLTAVQDLKIPLPSITEQRAIADALDDADGLVASVRRAIDKQRALRLGVSQALLSGRTRLQGFDDDWRLTRLDRAFAILPTASNSRADLVDGGDTGYIHYGDIHAATSPVLDCNLVSLPSLSSSKVRRAARLREGDLVLADASEDYAGIGKSVEVVNVAGRQIVAGLHTLLLRGDPALVADGFKCRLQFMPEFRASLARLATGISVLGISKSNLSSIELPLPGLDEQRAIAAILADLDAEIANLLVRLSKSRDLKTALAQELLSGRTRLG